VDLKVPFILHSVITLGSTASLGIFGYFYAATEFDADTQYRRHGDVNIVDAYRLNLVEVPPLQANWFALQCDGLGLGLVRVVPIGNDRIGIVLDQSCTARENLDAFARQTTPPHRMH
jgi:hypothetical protein